jgi:hypothetical protein
MEMKGRGRKSEAGRLGTGHWDAEWIVVNYLDDHFIYCSFG